MLPVLPQTTEDRVCEDARPPFAEPRAGQSCDAGARCCGPRAGLPGLGAGPGCAGDPAGRGASFSTWCMCCESRFMRWMSRWVTRAVLVRGVPELEGCPRTPAPRRHCCSCSAHRCSGSGAVPVVLGRGQGGWRRGSVRSSGVCQCGGALGSAFWVSFFSVSGLSGMKSSRPGSAPSEHSPLRASLPLCFLCALEGAGEWPVVAEFCGASVGASVTPGSAPPLTTARIPTIPGRKTHFNS